MSLVALTGQGKAILTLILTFKVFLIHPNSKMTAKNNFYRQAGTHICCGFTVNDLIMWESKVKSLFPQGLSEFCFFLESKCILIHDSRHFQPSNQKTYLSWTLHHVRVESQVVVSPGAQWILFILESKCILIHDSRHVQPSNQKTYLNWALHHVRVESQVVVSSGA